MILGRSRILWAALVAAALNAAVLVFHVPLDGGQLAAINAFALAILGVVANEADPTTAGTFERTLKAPRSGSISRT